MVNKLALGTVQFGLNYGINNQNGQTSLQEVAKILSYAKQSGIEVLDTAYAYGNSEKALGVSDLKTFKIISKIPPCQASEVTSYFESSLSRLGQDKLYGYLFHNFEAYTKFPESYFELKKIQDQGKIDKIGFSIYKPQELDYLLERDLEFQLVQFPYNILDQRFEPYLEPLNKRGVEVHVRSVFLQGLFFSNTSRLPVFFSELYPKLEQLNIICGDLGISKSALCLNFVINNPNISNVVMGVDKLNHLESNVEALQQADQVKKVIPQLMALKEDKEDFILPMNWKI